LNYTRLFVSEEDEMVTLTRLPALLKNVSGVGEASRDTIDGIAVRHLTARVDPYFWPGIVAADDPALAEGPLTIDVWIDDGGRLVRLEGATRNRAAVKWTLLIRTTVTFATDVPTTLAEPLPALVGEPRPKP